MRRIRIVYLVTGLDAGGAETMLSRLVARLSRERFDPIVISLMDGKLRGVIESHGVPVRTVGLRQGQLAPGALFRLIALVRDAQPDLIHGWMYHGNLAAQVVSFFIGRPPVLWCIRNSFHTFAVEKPLTRLMIRVSALLSRFPAKIVFVSHASRPSFEQIGFYAERSCVISNGFDTSCFKPSEEARQSVRTELGITAEAPLIGMMARYHPQKDHESFCRAAATVARDYPDVHFLLAGKGVDPENVVLAELLQSLQLHQRVHLLGERNDMARITAALDVATLSSSYGEGFSVAVGEAMSSGVPCVVTDVGDCALTVGDTGLVVPPKDSESLARGWIRLLSGGPEARRTLGQVARRRIEENFSLAAAVRKYEDLYASLVPIDKERDLASSQSCILSPES